MSSRNQSIPHFGPDDTRHRPRAEHATHHCLTKFALAQGDERLQNGHSQAHAVVCEHVAIAIRTWSVRTLNVNDDVCPWEPDLLPPCTGERPHRALLSPTPETRAHGAFTDPSAAIRP